MTFGLGSGPGASVAGTCVVATASSWGGLPAIDGVRITETPWSIDGIMQLRVDLLEIGEWGHNSADRAPSEYR